METSSLWSVEFGAVVNNMSASVVTMATESNPDDDLYLQIRLSIYIAIGVVGIVGNGMVIFVMCYSKSLRSKLTNMFIINQSILDLVGSMFLLMHSANRYYAGGHFGFWGQIYCRFWSTKVFMWSAFLSSTYNLVALTLERYFQVCHPIKHKTSFGPTQARIIFLGVWLIGPVYEIALFVPTSPANKDGVCEFMTDFPNQELKRFCGFLNAILKLFLPVFIMILAYSRMFSAIKKKIQPASDDSGKQTQTTSARDEKMANVGKNILKTLVGVSICYAICWTFNQFYFVWFNLGFPTDWTSPFYHFTVMMAFLNCCTNPFIYSVQYKHFQRETKRIFCGLRAGTDGQGESRTVEGSVVQ